MKQLLPIIGLSALLTVSGCNWMKQEESKTEDVQAQMADANSDQPSEETSADSDDDDALLADTTDMGDDDSLMGGDTSTKAAPASK